MEDRAYITISSGKQTDSPPRGEYSHPKPRSPKKWALHGLKPVGLSTGLHKAHTGQMDTLNYTGKTRETGSVLRQPLTKERGMRAGRRPRDLGQRLLRLRAKREGQLLGTGFSLGRGDNNDRHQMEVILHKPLSVLEHTAAYTLNGNGVVPEVRPHEPAV